MEIGQFEYVRAPRRLWERLSLLSIGLLAELDQALREESGHILKVINFTKLNTKAGFLAEIWLYVQKDLSSSSRRGCGLSSLMYDIQLCVLKEMLSNEIMNVLQPRW